MDYREVFGPDSGSTGYWTISQQGLFVGRPGATDADALLNQYALPTDWWYDRLDRPMATAQGGTPYDGVIAGADRDYHIASVGGNSTLSGNWLEVADPSTGASQPNVISVEANHNRFDHQIMSSTAVLPAGQQVEYTDTNFLLAAQDRADLARNMAIYALYGDGTDEELLYSFDTADGGSGPEVLGSATAGFSTAYTAELIYNTPSGPKGAMSEVTADLYEFSSPLVLDSSKTLYGLRIEDTNPTLQWNSRGLTVFAASATVFEEQQMAAPEPGSLALASLALGLLATRRRRR